SSPKNVSDTLMQETWVAGGSRSPSRPLRQSPGTPPPEAGVVHPLAPTGHSSRPSQDSGCSRGSKPRTGEAGRGGVDELRPDHRLLPPSRSLPLRLPPGGRPPKQHLPLLPTSSEARSEDHT